jgi:hypothetical protein
MSEEQTLKCIICGAYPDFVFITKAGAGLCNKHKSKESINQFKKFISKLKKKGQKSHERTSGNNHRSKAAV